MPNYELTVSARSGGVQRTALVRNADGAEAAAQHAMARGWNIDDIREVGAAYKAPAGAIEMNGAPGSLPAPAPPTALDGEAAADERRWGTLAGVSLALAITGFVFAPFAAVGMLGGALCMGQTSGRSGGLAVKLGGAAVFLWTIGVAALQLMLLDRFGT